jgi:hypothetical protein
MNYDYYAEARNLAEMLKKEDLSAWATKILTAMEEGVTSTEILMMLRWNIDNFLSAQQGSKNLVNQAQQLRQKINSALH